MSRRGGWGWRLRSAWPWVLVAFFLLWFVPYAGTQSATSSEPSPNLPSELSWSDNLSEADQNLQLLLPRLEERKKQVESLQISLQEARRSSEDSEKRSAILGKELKAANSELMRLQMELRATLYSLAGVRTQYDMLSEAFGAYVATTREQMQGIIAERDAAARQARLWRLVGLIGVPIIVVEAIALVVTIVMLVRGK